MAQLFKPRANAITKAVLVGGGIFAIVLCAVVYAVERADYYTRVEVPLPQPVPFSHEHHVAGLGIDCRYCHTSVEKSASAGIPPTETCMTCHSQIWTEAPVLQLVRDSWQTGQPLRWTRVHDLPGYVYFNHSIHINKGIGCVTCHGRVDQMPITWKEQRLEMRWCLNCHRNPEAALRNPEDLFTMTSHLTDDPQRVAAEVHLNKRGLTDCVTCHR